MLYRTTIAAAMVAAALSLTAAAAQEDPRYPDWSGQWRKAPDGGPPRYDPSKPDGAGQQAPLKEEYQRIHEASMADQAKGGQGLYVMSVKCIPMGMPFQMSIVFPFELVITPKTTYVLFEIMTSQPRRIYTDGRDWPKDPDPTFTGYSIGKWKDEDGDGRFDVLEVETRHLRVPRLFDQTGIPFHEDGESVIKERIYADKANPNIIYDEITTIDNALTHPWSIKKTYRREPKVVWPENNCTEGNNDVVIGSENYLLSADGYLMPVKKDQPPPDLRYFNQPKK
jgi:hypothetical protein